MAKSREPVTTIPVDQCKEVQDLEDSEQAIRTLINGNQGFYEQLCRLTAERNQRLEAASKVIRPTGQNCGPFIKLSETEKINAEKLFEEVGASDFQALGGYTETVVQYKVDRVRFLAHASKGDLPQDVVEAVLTISPSYKKIEPYVLP